MIPSHTLSLFVFMVRELIDNLSIFYEWQNSKHYFF